MHLSNLLSGINCQIKGNSDLEITSLCCHTKSATLGSLYFCLNGNNTDGHAHAKQAVSNGAVALVVQRYLEIPITQILVQDSRSVMSLVAKRFYDNACDSLKIVCVVGTNGKTSTTYILNAIFSSFGKKCAVIGTNGIFVGRTRYGSALTTPDPIELHKSFLFMAESGVEYVFMEVSAHAIYYKKLEGIKAAVTVFTNFSQDHLDFFGTMKRYAQVKKSFFCQNYTKTAVVNADEIIGQELLSAAQIPTLSYGYNSPSDVFAMDYCETAEGISYTVNACSEVAKVNYSLRGKFNLYNTLCATAVARVFGIKLDNIVKGINMLKRIDGRNEYYYRKDGCRVVIDFAHTPDGVSNILSHLKETTQGRLICVFGCGGERDRFKRPLMAKAVSQYCDFAIITNDNPRCESENGIIADIECGMSICYQIITSRAEAIEKALTGAEYCDTVAILGKGAEEYQEIKGERIPYNDADVLAELLN